MKIGLTMALYSIFNVDSGTKGLVGQWIALHLRVPDILFITENFKPFVVVIFVGYLIFLLHKRIVNK